MLDIIGNFSSILGLFLTIATFIYAFLIEKKLKNFEKNVLFNNRIPILTKILKDNNSRLAKELGILSERKIKEAINYSKTTILDINTKVPTDLSKQALRIVKRLNRQYKSEFLFNDEKKSKWTLIFNETNTDDLWETYDILNSFIIRIDNFRKDKKVIK